MVSRRQRWCAPVGTAIYDGDMARVRLNQPVVGITATPDGGGYWLVAADGGVFAFGDAPFLGSMAGHRLNAPVVGITATPDGGGYWLVAAERAYLHSGMHRFSDQWRATVLTLRSSDARGHTPRDVAPWRRLVCGSDRPLSLMKGHRPKLPVRPPIRLIRTPKPKYDVVENGGLPYGPINDPS